MTTMKGLKEALWSRSLVGDKSLGEKIRERSLTPIILYRYIKA